MEKNRRLSDVVANRHETRLVITHDSPHRGANVPVGIQAFIRLLASDALITRLIPQINQGISLVNESASQQMLIYHLIRNSANNYSYQTNTFLDGDYRTMITFPTNNPAPYRFVATSNGSECGNLVVQPGTNLVDINGNFFLNFLPFATNRFRTELNINALPNQVAGQPVFKFRLWFRTCLFGLICIQRDLLNEQANSAANLLAYDGAPGGTNPINGFVGSGTLSYGYNFLWLVRANAGANLANAFTFVPSVSALDIQTINSQSINAIYTNGISPNNPSRAANFVAQERVNASTFNTEHILFTARNSEWMFREMQATSPNNLNCAQNNLCSPPITITPENGTYICSSGTYRFSVPAVAGATYNWVVGNGIQIDPPMAGSGQGTNVIFVRANSGFSGTSTVGLVLGTNCGNINTTPINVRVASTTQPVNFFTNGWPGLDDNYLICQCLDNLFYVDFNNSNYTYQWTVSGGAITNGISNTAQIVAVFPGLTGTVELKIFDQCGLQVTRFYYEFNLDGCGGCDGNPNPLRISPNPASEQLTVQAEVNSNITDFEAVLYNSTGEVVDKAPSKQGKCQLNTQKLKKGIYILRVSHAQGVETKRIIIEK